MARKIPWAGFFSAPKQGTRLGEVSIEFIHVLVPKRGPNLVHQSARKWPKKGHFGWFPKVSKLVIFLQKCKIAVELDCKVTNPEF